ncbi:MAG: hypothetical protein IKF53_02435 [Clostridia bacterium]|nr:hypothetical protein [Clostridia bacterium]
MKKVLTLIISVLLILTAFPIMTFAADLESISYKPLEDVVYYEYSDGEWTKDHQNNDYFFYHTNFHIGDILTLNYSDTTSIEYTAVFENNEIVFVSNNNNRLMSWRDVSIYHEQEQEKWQANNSYTYYVEYSGFRAPVKVEIKVNPVKSIEYKKANNIEMFKDSNTSIDYFEGNEYVRYNYRSKEPGDILTITDNNDNKKEYVFTEDNETHNQYYISSDNEIIDERDVDIFDEQNRTPWTIGSDNEIIVEYFGKRCFIYATIIESPIKSIDFIPKNKPELFEGVNCYYDSIDNRTYYKEPDFENGDKLIVSDKDDNVIEYICRLNEFFEPVFEADGYDSLNRDEVNIYSNQREKPYEIGDNNEYYVSYLGSNVKLYCTLLPNPVVSIKYTPINKTEYLENTNMYFDEWENKYFYEKPRLENGDVLSVTYTDNTTIDYIGRYDFETNSTIFVSDSNEIIYTRNNSFLNLYDDQFDNPWGIGEHYVTIEYYGKKDSIPVNIKENNISSISYTPIKTPLLYSSNYHIEYDEDHNEHKIYDIPGFSEGDVLTVYDNNGNGKDYTLTFNELDGERYFVNGDEKIHEYEISRNSEQDKNEWGTDKDNYYFIELYGFKTSISVMMIDTDVKYVDYIKKEPIVLKENTDGEYRYDQNMTLYFHYFFQYADQGDKIIITYFDNSVEEYTIEFDVEKNEGYAISANGDILSVEDIEIFDRQYDEHWVVGKENRYYLLYKGVETSIPVTIEAEYIKGDVNGDNQLTDQDAIYTLFHYYFPDLYPVYQSCDFNGDGILSDQDAIYLLFHYYFTELYPLKN